MLQNLLSLPQLSFCIVTTLQQFRHITPQRSLSVTLRKTESPSFCSSYSLSLFPAIIIIVILQYYQWKKSKQGECTPQITPVPKTYS